MKKEYTIRGRKVVVDELENVRAVKPAIKTNESFRNIATSLDNSAKVLFKNLQQDLPIAKDQLMAYSNAGWVFVQPSQANITRLDSRSFTSPDIIQSNKVYADQRGNVIISTNKINVKLVPEMDAAEAETFLRENHLSITRAQGYAPNLYEVETAAADVIAVVNQLAASKFVVYAEPQMITHLPHRFRPTDPLYVSQWHHHNDGINGLKSGADVKSEMGWNTFRGSGIKLAIIDNGFDVGHPDLAPAVHASSGHFFQSRTGVVFRKGVAGFPDEEHGTFCAGMAVARENNGSGGCGVAHQADFIAIACLPDQTGTQATLARAIAYAADPATELPGTPSGMGADVISCSLGPNGAHWMMESVLEDALIFASTRGRGGKGTAIFWAVSNGTFPIQSDEVSASPHTISVGRSRSDDMEDGSAFGPELDFLAPGVDVFSTVSGGGYGFSSGTSFATPLAAGVAAVVLSKRPALTAQQLRDILHKSCDKVGPIPYVQHRNDRYGHGRINLFEALRLA
jgi:subtilisin family serine protease